MEPTVVDEELCRRCISVRRTSTQTGEQTDAAKKDAANTPFTEVDCLIFSFKNILKIDNLIGFDRLVKLQLDNNIIERVENLSHLHALEWLDLSFNNISEISGLESLTSLTNLSFFSNRITSIGNLDTLKNLQLLSLGNNLIRNLDSIMYLRPFAHLQAVNFVGNPFCQESEYRAYVLAHLKHVKYLDYRLVDDQAITSAREQYQDELLDLEESEAAAEVEEATAGTKAERKALLKAASLPDMDTIFDDVMTKGDGDVVRLRSHPLLQEPLTQLQEQADAASEEFVAALLAFHTSKIEEHKEFSLALTNAKQKSDNDSKAEIAKYRALKKRSLGEVSGGEQPQAVVQALQEANAALYEKLMDLEMGAAERYVETISAFESAYDELSKKTLETSTGYFQRLRDLEAAYQERLLAAGTELLEKFVAEQGEVEGLSEEAKMLVHDKDTLFGALNTAHDARISRLDAKEDEVRIAEERAFGKIVLKALDEEYLRNRTRVTEIWNLVNVVNGNELNALGASRDDE
tara:strand:- start:78 stop:1637 length:1560 start_codon:yes stop_codon:yes gene_type:complete